MGSSVRRPGFNDFKGNRRVNRFGSGGARNSMLKRLRQIAGTTIGFDAVPAPDEITDSANGLDVFSGAERVGVHGSTSNDGEYTVGISGVSAGALEVVQALTTEVAGDQVRLRSENNRFNSRYANN